MKLKNSGIQAIVSTGNYSKTMIHKWSKAEVSLPLCKGARSNNSLMEQNWKILQEQALAGTTKVNMKDSFTKKAIENGGNIQNSGEREANWSSEDS